MNDWMDEHSGWPAELLAELADMLAEFTKGEPMIVCDACEKKSDGSTPYVDNVVANMSIMSSDGRPMPSAKDGKTTSSTRQIWRGQLCQSCFDAVLKKLVECASSCMRKGESS